jgi:hypothetical protein
MTINNHAFLNGMPSAPALKEVAASVLTAFLTQYPFVATDLGLHDFDGELPPVDAPSQQAFRQHLQTARESLRGVRGETLDLDDWADYTTLRHNVEALWLDASRDHPERHDPNLFNGVISESLLTLVRGQFGTPRNRAQAALSRLRQVPGFLSAALRQFEDPPALFVDMAIEQFTQTVPFLRQDVPEAFQEVKGSLAQEIADAVEKAANAYRQFARDLQTQVRPQSHGDYRLGAERYHEKLFWQEGIDTPLPELLSRGEKELARLRERLARLTAQWAPNRSVGEVLHEIGQDHWTMERLLPETAQLLSGLHSFVQGRNLITIPESANPSVVQTPAFMRMTTLASIVPPGPFEQASCKAHFPGYAARPKLAA